MLTPATPAFVAALPLPPAALREATDAYLAEPRGRWHGQGLVVAPATTSEVAAVVRACAQAKVGVVPFAGGTGLVGGQVMAEGAVPLILSFERMTAIRAVHPQENVLVAEAGVILSQVRQVAAEAGRLFPLSLASEGSARIGGLLATNAGGTATLRYGNARALCLGVEAVTAQGEVWNGLTRLRKDNAGYDLRDLLIGSEGTLALITAAALRLVPRPVASGVALLSTPSPAAALDLLALAQDLAGDGVSAFELIDRTGVAFLDEAGLGQPHPLQPMPAWSVLIELGLPQGLSPQTMLEDLFTRAVGQGLTDDGTIAASDAQAKALWRLREMIPLANRRIGAVSSHDISVPLSEIPRMIDRGTAAVAALGPFRVNCFGHLGDGNLHFNVFPPQGGQAADHADLRGAVKQAVHDIVQELGGSVAAEHGVGRVKVGDLERYGDPVKLGLMRAVKRALDPQGILNPGAVLRPLP